jgi:hypothetical protein
VARSVHGQGDLAHPDVRPATNGLRSFSDSGSAGLIVAVRNKNRCGRKAESRGDRAILRSRYVPGAGQRIIRGTGVIFFFVPVTEIESL